VAEVLGGVPVTVREDEYEPFNQTSTEKLVIDRLERSADVQETLAVPETPLTVAMTLVGGSGVDMVRLTDTDPLPEL